MSYSLHQFPMPTPRTYWFDELAAYIVEFVQEKTVFLLDRN